MKYRDILMAILVIFAISCVSMTYADVKYVGEDTKTKGNWTDKYGKKWWGQ